MWHVNHNTTKQCLRHFILFSLCLQDAQSTNPCRARSSISSLTVTLFWPYRTGVPFSSLLWFLHPRGSTHLAPHSGLCIYISWLDWHCDCILLGWHNAAEVHGRLVSAQPPQKCPLPILSMFRFHRCTTVWIWELKVFTTLKKHITKALRPYFWYIYRIKAEYDNVRVEYTMSRVTEHDKLGIWRANRKYILSHLHLTFTRRFWRDEV